MQRTRATRIALVIMVAALAASCGPRQSVDRDGAEALRLVRATHAGDLPIDREIRRLQERIADARDPLPHLDRLGWAFVQKARNDADPGYYHLAERCGVAMEELGADGPEAWLLRGHALHGLHRFDEAEPLARRLVAERGLAFDHGLLGDVLLDRGDLEEAIATYQRMADLRPDHHALIRAARARFLTGDVRGATAAATRAARATSPRNAESFAWTWSQLALYQLELGSLEAALSSADTALAVSPEAASALVARGRILLALGRTAEALAPLRAAARSSPLPDALWTLAEALHAAGLLDEEAAARTRLVETGAGTDPRGLALYLASHGREPARALALARRELDARPDVYSFDALAWAQAADGRIDEARANIRRALAAGTRDARLFLHAGVIAAAAGEAANADRWLAEANALRHTLLPSQQAELDARLGTSRATTGSS